MVCRECGCEEFRVIDVDRNQRWNNDKKLRVINGNCDTREIVCRNCQQHYITGSYLEFAKVYDPQSFKILIIEINDFKPKFKSNNSTSLF